VHVALPPHCFVSSIFMLTLVYHTIGFLYIRSLGVVYTVVNSRYEENILAILFRC
jgi:hypothetical protein